MPEASGRPRLDIGRLIIVPAFGAILCVDVIGLDRGSHAGVAGLLRTLGAVLVLAFYALVIWCYLRRGPALATSGSVTAHAAAIAATWLPFRASASARRSSRTAPPGSV